MYLIRATIALLLAIMLSACGTALRVTYYSDPPGATIYSNGQTFGYAPVTLQYEVTKEQKKQGFVTVNSVEARWASGATASSGILDIDLKQYGLNQQLTLYRPNEVSGREIDAQFYLQLEQTRAAQRQAAAMEQQAAAQKRQADAQEKQTRQRKSTTYCNSTVVGQNIDTICY